MKIGIFFGSDNGDTENVCNRLAQKVGSDKFDIFNVKTNPIGEVLKYEKIIFALSTHGDGELQKDYRPFAKELEKLDLSGKTVAILGLGNQAKHPTTYCDGMGTLSGIVKSATIIGQTSTDGYEFETSKAVVNSKFVGLSIDEKSQPELTDTRLESWIQQNSAFFA